MNIIKIEFKNFNSYGNEWSTIDFQNGVTKGYLNLVIGGNGCGKSTISEVLSFALYGKVEGKTKPSLVNRINKGLEVKIFFKSKGKLVFIHRGINPNFIDILIDNKPLKDANANVDKLQTYLEDELYEIPYLVFKNVLVLSIDDFKSFLTMSPSDRRAITDKLFGFSIINSIKDSTKEEKKIYKDKLNLLNNEYETTKKYLNNLEAKLNILKNQNVNTIKEELNQTNGLLQDKKNGFNQIIIDDKFLKELKIKETKINNSLNNTKTDFKINEKSLNLYNNAKCPTCGGDLKDVIHINEKMNLLNQKNQIEILAKELLTNLKKIQNEIKIEDDKIKELNSERNKIKLEIESIERNKKQIENKIKNSIESSSEKEMNDLINDSRNRIIEIERDINELEQDLKFLDTFEDSVGDNGLKSYIMKSILPQLNLQIMKFLTDLHIHYRIEFDSTFSVKITSMDMEISASSMSTGERKLSDFICILSILQILKSKYPSINLLFLDEIFSSIEPNIVYEMTKLLNNIANQDKIHTFVINHTTLPSEFFNHTIEISKENGFSILISKEC